jgi:hypothetical protein
MALRQTEMAAVHGVPMNANRVVILGLRMHHAAFAMGWSST